MHNIIRFETHTAVEHIQGTAPNPVSGNPVTNVWRCFVHSSGKLTAGIWSCEGGSFEILSHPSNEMCTILEGEAVVEHSDGTTVTLSPGDTILIPFGVHTIWHVPGYVKKSFICNFNEDTLSS